MEVDPRVRWRCELVDEGDRLRQPGLGELVRLRTWDILGQLLPAAARIADVGGGPERTPPTSPPRAAIWSSSRALRTERHASCHSQMRP